MSTVCTAGWTVLRFPIAPPFVGGVALARGEMTRRVVESTKVTDASQLIDAESAFAHWTAGRRARVNRGFYISQACELRRL